MMTHKQLVKHLVAEALAEDAREDGHFDADGWSNFFIEDWEKNPDAVAEAWREYERLVYGPTTQKHAAA